MTLSDFLQSQNQTNVEGNCSQVPGQITRLHQLLVENPKVVKVLEIGFNAGHSTELFLGTRSDIQVTSFDLGGRAYVQIGKSYIDSTFPGRHTLIIGDSSDTVPNFIREQGSAFDLIFIDGSHQYQAVKKDIIHCKYLAHTDTLVILDDTIVHQDNIREWNQGPNNVWAQATEYELVQPIHSEDYGPGRGMSWGKYRNPHYIPVPNRIQ